jgi:cytochrome c oxidase subunit 2
VKRFWALFFFFWPAVTLVVCWIAPSRGWWFPSDAMSPLGEKIDGLFYLILAIVAITFVGTQFALGWVLWQSATKDEDKAAHFSHGSHSLELIWTIVPAFILVFIALYQMDVWMEFRVQASFPDEAKAAPVVEVTARQFEWRMRYPAPGKLLQNTPQPDDLYTVNEMHVPAGRPVRFTLRSGDVQHAFFAPELRVKQDAVPGLDIPMWFEIPVPGKYELLCAELCGWGHYKMPAIIYAEPENIYQEYLTNLQQEQNFDGVVPEAEEDE